MAKVDILILTVVQTEFLAVKRLMNSFERIKDNRGTIYTIGDFGKYKIGLRRSSDQGNIVMAAEAEKAISFLSPSVVILVGIAGGRKKLTFGDVVVVTRTYSYESGKETDDGFKFRDKGGQFNFELTELAKSEMDSTDWIKYTTHKNEKYKILDGPIACGEKLVTSTKTYLAEQIDRHCEDALAIEMECIGLSSVLHTIPNIKGINIRGISDLLDDKDQAYDKGYRDLAAENAAAFAFNLIEKMTLISSVNKLTETDKIEKEKHIKTVGDGNIVVSGNSGDVSINQNKDSFVINNNGKVEKQINIGENKGAINMRNN